MFFPLALFALHVDTHLIPGAVIDVTRNRVVSISPAGGIQALSARTGSAEWTSKRADWPLEICGDCLVAARADKRPDIFELVVLDLATGTSRQVKPGVVNLPDWIRFEFNYDDPSCLQMQSRPLDDGRVQIDWLALRPLAGLAPDTLRFNRPMEARGSVAFDPRTGEVSPAPLKSLPFGPYPNLVGDDETRPGHTVLWQPKVVGSRKMYLSQSLAYSAYAPQKVNLRLVAIDSASSELVWETSLGVRNIAKFRT